MTQLSSCAQNFFNELCGVNVIANPGQQTAIDDDCLLIIGQLGPNATAEPGFYPYNGNSAATDFGVNGTLMQSIEEVLDPQGAPTADIYVYAAPAVVGTPGTAEVEILGAGQASAAGVVYIWVNGQVYSTAFNPAVDTNASVAARLQAVIAAENPYLIVTVASDNILQIETTEHGEVAGFLDVRASYSCQPQNITSPDVTLNITQVAGTGFPNLSGLPDGAQGCQFVANPYTDPASMANVEKYLCAQWSGGASSRAHGVYYGGSVAAAQLAKQTNDPKFAYVGVFGALTPPYLESAALTAIMYNRLNCKASDITSSLSGQVMPGMLAPEAADLYSNAEKAALIESGMGYFNVTRAKDVVIGRAVTTYTTADNGTLDTSLQDVNKPAVYACMSRRLTDGLTAKFTGYTFRTDGVVGGGSRRVTTVEGVENCIISFAQEFDNENMLQNIDAFIDSLVVELDADSGCILVRTNPDIPCPLCCMNVYLGAG